MKNIYLTATLTLTIAVATLAQTTNKNITLQSTVTYPAGNQLSNIGGIVDSIGNEYALVGWQQGLDIVNITNPTAQHAHALELKGTGNLDELLRGRNTWVIE